MKKYFLFLFVLVTLLTLNSCKSKSSNGPSIEGEWGDCNGWSPEFTITKQGDVLMLRTKTNDIALEKKTDELYTGMGGVITLSYDVKRGHWFLSGVKDRKIEFCRKSEVS